MSRKKRAPSLSKTEKSTENKKITQPKKEIPKKTRLTRRIVISGKNESQKKALKMMKEKDIIMITGMAGSGKSFLASSWALNEIVKGTYKNIIITRPCVEANGEKLGYLPGDFNEKIAPYMMPVFSCLTKYITQVQLQKLIDDKIIMTIPLAYLRGFTFEDTIVIADEMQNTIPEQTRLLLTRKGPNSKIILNGDLNQSDIKYKNGLADACDRLQGIDEIGIVHLEEPVRDPIIAKIEERYKEK